MKKNKRISRKIIIGVATIFLLILINKIYISLGDRDDKNDLTFNAGNAFDHVERQMDYGARFPGSDGHKQVQDYIKDLMLTYGWKVETQIGMMNGHELKNIICSKGSSEKAILFGAHYDTRLFASNEDDVDLAGLPVPGANDGASGVAVLLELARLIPDDDEYQFIIVFFDQEDNGGINGADWAMGSRYYADNLDIYLEKVIIVDMVGDVDLDIYREKNSNMQLNDEIWDTASELGFDEFINEEKYSMIDDHSAFILKGIETALIIDFDYPYWHTIEDTIDNISPDSLKIVGDTILSWIYKEIYNE